MIQPARVLPSNAPPLRDGDSIHQASRVLQEHSGNRQQHELGFSEGHETKYPPDLLTENNFPEHIEQRQQQQQYEHLYHPQPQHRQALRYGYARGAYRYAQPAPELEARFQAEADRLFRRFRESAQYMKYRQKQAKDDKGNGEQKWPDHLERAFCYALVRYLPMGRRKSMHKDKQRGRNELIADWIEEITGEARTRKQVSSHIQVLKPFVLHDPLIMKYLSKEDHASRVGSYGGHASMYGGGRRASNYPVTAPPHPIRTTMPPLPRTETHDIQKLKGNLELFEPLSFQMFVQQKYRAPEDREETVHRLHTYTESLPRPLGDDLQMSDWHTINRDFPLLAALHTQRPIDCNILVAEASLAFPLETWKDRDGSPLPGVELGISFMCGSRHLPPTRSSLNTSDHVKCINNFYEGGVHVKDQSGACDVRLETSERGGGGVETQIKFGSTFWAKTLGCLAKRLLDTSKDNTAEVASHLKSITALQEVFAPTSNGHERILVIHWTFRQSSCAKGRASWRRLLLPPPGAQYTDPVKPERADSMYDYGTQAIDTAVTQIQQQQPLPALQSPFEYDSGSAGSALSSATWPTFASEGSFAAQQSGNVDFSDNSFDFNAGNINITYDPNLNFDNFDSCGFDFDTTATDFVADPTLQDYSQPWCDSLPSGFEGQQTVGENAAYTIQPEFGGAVPAFDHYSGPYEQQHYGGPHDQQAYGGAGQELVVKDEDALAALADASYLASAM